MRFIIHIVLSLVLLTPFAWTQEDLSPEDATAKEAFEHDSAIEDQKAAEADPESEGSIHINHLSAEEKNTRYKWTNDQRIQNERLAPLDHILQPWVPFDQSGYSGKGVHLSVLRGDISRFTHEQYLQRFFRWNELIGRLIQNDLNPVLAPLDLQIIKMQLDQLFRPANGEGYTYNNHDLFTDDIQRLVDQRVVLSYLNAPVELGLCDLDPGQIKLSKEDGKKLEISIEAALQMRKMWAKQVENSPAQIQTAGALPKKAVDNDQILRLLSISLTKQLEAITPSELRPIPDSQLENYDSKRLSQAQEYLSQIVKTGLILETSGIAFLQADNLVLKEKILTKTAQQLLAFDELFSDVSIKPTLAYVKVKILPLLGVFPTNRNAIALLYEKIHVQTTAQALQQLDYRLVDDALKNVGLLDGWLGRMAKTQVMTRSMGILSKWMILQSYHQSNREEAKWVDDHTFARLLMNPNSKAKNLSSKFQWAVAPKINNIETAMNIFEITRNCVSCVELLLPDPIHGKYYLKIGFSAHKLTKYFPELAKFPEAIFNGNIPMHGDLFVALDPTDPIIAQDLANQETNQAATKTQAAKLRYTPTQELSKSHIQSGQRYDINHPDLLTHVQHDLALIAETAWLMEEKGLTFINATTLKEKEATLEALAQDLLQHEEIFSKQQSKPTLAQAKVALLPYIGILPAKRKAVVWVFEALGANAMLAGMAQMDYRLIDRTLRSSGVLDSWPVNTTKSYALTSSNTFLSKWMILQQYQHANTSESSWVHASLYRKLLIHPSFHHQSIPAELRWDVPPTIQTMDDAKILLKSIQSCASCIDPLQLIEDIQLGEYDDVLKMGYSFATKIPNLKKQGEFILMSNIKNGDAPFDQPKIMQDIPTPLPDQESASKSQNLGQKFLTWFKRKISDNAKQENITFQEINESPESTENELNYLDWVQRLEAWNKLTLDRLQNQMMQQVNYDQLLINIFTEFSDQQRNILKKKYIQPRQTFALTTEGPSTVTAQFMTDFGITIGPMPKADQKEILALTLNIERTHTETEKLKNNPQMIGPMSLGLKLWSVLENSRVSQWMLQKNLDISKPSFLPNTDFPKEDDVKKQSIKKDPLIENSIITKPNILATDPDIVERESVEALEQLSTQELRDKPYLWVDGQLVYEIDFDKIANNQRLLAAAKSYFEFFEQANDADQIDMVIEYQKYKKRLLTLFELTNTPFTESIQNKLWITFFYAHQHGNQHPVTKNLLLDQLIAYWTTQLNFFGPKHPRVVKIIRGMESANIFAGPHNPEIPKTLFDNNDIENNKQKTAEKRKIQTMLWEKIRQEPILKALPKTSHFEITLPMWNPNTERVSAPSSSGIITYDWLKAHDVSIPEEGVIYNVASGTDFGLVTYLEQTYNAHVFQVDPVYPEHSDVRIIKGLAEDLPFQNETADRVFIIEPIMVEPELSLLEALRVLKIEGEGVIGLHGMGDISEALESAGMIEVKQKLGHLHLSHVHFIKKKSFNISSYVEFAKKSLAYQEKNLRFNDYLFHLYKLLHIDPTKVDASFIELSLKPSLRLLLNEGKNVRLYDTVTIVSSDSLNPLRNQTIYQETILYIESIIQAQPSLASNIIQAISTVEISEMFDQAQKNELLTYLTGIESAQNINEPGNGSGLLFFGMNSIGNIINKVQTLLSRNSNAEKPVTQDNSNNQQVSNPVKKNYLTYSQLFEDIQNNGIDHIEQDWQKAIVHAYINEMTNNYEKILNFDYIESAFKAFPLGENKAHITLEWTDKNQKKHRMRRLHEFEQLFTTSLDGCCQSNKRMVEEIDPRFEYFTVVDELGKMSGKITLVRGFSNPAMTQPAMLLYRVQDINAELLHDYLSALYQYVKETGMDLVLPSGGPGESVFISDSHQIDKVYRAFEKIQWNDDFSNMRFFTPEFSKNNGDFPFPKHSTLLYQSSSDAPMVAIYRYKTDPVLLTPEHKELLTSLLRQYETGMKIIPYFNLTRILSTYNIDYQFSARKFNQLYENYLASDQLRRLKLLRTLYRSPKASIYLPKFAYDLFELHRVQAALPKIDRTLNHYDGLIDFIFHSSNLMHIEDMQNDDGYVKKQFVRYLTPFAQMLMQVDLSQMPKIENIIQNQKDKNTLIYQIAMEGAHVDNVPSGNASKSPQPNALPSMQDHQRALNMGTDNAHQKSQWLSNNGTNAKTQAERAFSNSELTAEQKLSKALSILRKTPGTQMQADQRMYLENLIAKEGVYEAVRNKSNSEKKALFIKLGQEAQKEVQDKSSTARNIKANGIMHAVNAGQYFAAMYVALGMRMLVEGDISFEAFSQLNEHLDSATINLLLFSASSGTMNVIVKAMEKQGWLSLSHYKANVNSPLKGLGYNIEGLGSTLGSRAGLILRSQAQMYISFLVVHAFTQGFEETFTQEKLVDLAIVTGMFGAVRVVGGMSMRSLGLALSAHKDVKIARAGAAMARMVTSVGRITPAGIIYTLVETSVAMYIVQEYEITQARKKVYQTSMKDGLALYGLRAQKGFNASVMSLCDGFDWKRFETAPVSILKLMYDHKDQSDRTNQARSMYRQCLLNQFHQSTTALYHVRGFDKMDFENVHQIYQAGIDQVDLEVLGKYGLMQGKVGPHTVVSSHISDIGQEQFKLYKQKQSQVNHTWLAALQEKQEAPQSKLDHQMMAGVVSGLTSLDASSSLDQIAMACEKVDDFITCITDRFNSLRGRHAKEIFNAVPSRYKKGSADDQGNDLAEGYFNSHANLVGGQYRYALGLQLLGRMYMDVSKGQSDEVSDYLLSLIEINMQGFRMVEKGKKKLASPEVLTNPIELPNYWLNEKAIYGSSIVAYQQNQQKIENENSQLSGVNVTAQEPLAPDALQTNVVNPKYTQDFKTEQNYKNQYGYMPQVQAHVLPAAGIISAEAIKDYVLDQIIEMARQEGVSPDQLETKREQARKHLGENMWMQDASWWNVECSQQEQADRQCKDKQYRVLQIFSQNTQAMAADRLYMNYAGRISVPKQFFVQ